MSNENLSFFIKKYYAQFSQNKWSFEEHVSNEVLKVGTSENGVKNSRVRACHFADVIIL